MLTMDVDTPSLKKLIVHYAGNRNAAEPLHLSEEALQLDAETLKLLQDGLLHRFKTIPEHYQFQHETSLQYHEMHGYCKTIFENAAALEEVSMSIARHLYAASTHPKVKGGELYVAYFEGLPMDSRMHKAIGIFKTENKSIFMEVGGRPGAFSLQVKEGVEPGRIDKGCLVIQSREEAGFDVLLFDNQNRGEEALYWKEGFLGVAPQKNEFHQTSHFLTLTKQFITEQLDTEFKLPRTEQVALLNKSIDYFKGRDAFDIDEFQTEVFANEDVIGSFRQFGSRYIESNDFDLAAQFDISPQAVKKQTRIFKSVVKLDKNFHIYIHGRTDLIEKGVDLDGRKFYKIYYQEEA